MLLALLAPMFEVRDSVNRKFGIINTLYKIFDKFFGGDDLIERIMGLMKERGLSGIQLSAKIGLSKNAVSEWKAGKAKPGHDAIIKLASFFEVSADYLLGLTDDRTLIGGDGKKKILRTLKRYSGKAA